MRIAIVGAGVSGLGAAINLAHDSHDVVLLERDATPLPGSPDEAFEWNRRGAPQVRHSHAFLARGRNLIRDRLPEVRESLLAAGATEMGWPELIPADASYDRTPEPGDEDLVMLACRRTTFEWVLRGSALETDRVDLRDGVLVDGLHITDGRVTGLHTSHGDIEADLVVDATGRPSHLIDLLSNVGVQLTETKLPSGIVYLSRFYRMKGEKAAPAFAGSDLQYLKYAVFRGDNHTFSVTLAYDPDDAQLASLRDPIRYDKAIAQIPNINEWTNTDAADAISPVHYMGGLINRVRHFVVDGEPVVRGLVAIGDSSVCTNPLYGRGCSLGLVHGALLTDTLRSDPDDLELAFDEQTKEHLVPWYDASVAADRVSNAIAKGEELSDADRFGRELIQDGVFPAAAKYPSVSRTWFRSFNLLAKPFALMEDADVMAKALECYQERDTREPEPLAGPDRETLFKNIEEA